MAHTSALTDHSVGIKLFTVWEKGHPDHAGYFNATQGNADAVRAVEFAFKIGQPKGSVTFMAIDYDSKPSEVDGYVMEAHATLKDHGYLMGLYGNGLTLGHFEDAGYSHCGWLSQSHGFAGYKEYAHRAAIIQGPEKQVLGMDCDLDTVVKVECTW